MNEEYTYKEAFLNHRNAQAKFDYFFLGVILAALSLSIQTFNVNDNSQFAFLLFLSWFLLLFSFIAGFFRQERLNLMFSIEAERISFADRKNTIQNATVLLKPNTNIWTQDEIQKYLDNANSFLSLSDIYLRKYEYQSILAYQLQKWFFLFAIWLYIIFKIANYYLLSTWGAITILFVSIIVSIIVIKTYKYYLHKN